MIAIILAKFRMFIRNPWTFIIFTVMSLGFAFIIGGNGAVSTITVPITAEEGAIENINLKESLENEEAFRFNWLDEEEMRNQIENGKAEAGVILSDDSYQLIIGVESPNVSMIEQAVQRAYMKHNQKEAIVKAAEADTEDKRETLLQDFEATMESPVFEVETTRFTSEDAVIYDNTFQSLFGFTLFFVIYTIAYNLLPILVEKREGIWDRMILSPVKKWEVYVANLVYSFLEGYIQIVIIFCVFHYGLKLDFYGKFVEVLLLSVPYVFAIVALSILLTAIVKNVQQFNAVIPIIAVSMAMIGGAYWPLEIVESEILIALSKINPITYGMEILNGVVLYGYSFEELLYPISILVLMGVVMTGLGIHLMERRHV
ncbi:ABC transporter permease [Oceanobacillus manasiensis]|uniref:ABC transporter permease n=1 Tax=Oceanobacillus manasiensis TaxID=586413 RepID=UPI0005A7454E|nr:ABC transporter permease [Oceanobacillus manasiensis]